MDDSKPTVTHFVLQAVTEPEIEPSFTHDAEVLVGKKQQPLAHLLGHHVHNWLCFYPLPDMSWEVYFQQLTGESKTQ